MVSHILCSLLLRMPHVPDGCTIQSVLQSLLTVMEESLLVMSKPEVKNKITGLRNITVIGKIAKGKLLWVIHFWGQENCTWAHTAHEVHFLDDVVIRLQEVGLLDRPSKSLKLPRLNFKKDLKIQLTLEEHRFELSKSTYMQVYFNE